LSKLLVMLSINDELFAMNNKKPRLHQDIAELDITIDSFGEINANFDIDKLNSFLNKNISDKKLKDRKDLGVKE